MVRNARDVSSADFHEDSENVPPVADGAEGKPLRLSQPTFGAGGGFRPERRGFTPCPHGRGMFETGENPLDFRKKSEKIHCFSIKKY